MVDRGKARLLWSPSIRHRHLKQLVDSAVALGGPTLDQALWRRLQPFAAGDPGELPADPRLEARRLRALVAGSLQALAERLEQTLAPALAGARQNWDKVDNQTIVDSRLEAAVASTRHALERAATRADAAGAVALEGLMALEAARGLIRLAEQRMSSLIRLRVRQDEDLLPGGRPFLDLGAALAEAARAWA